MIHSRPGISSQVLKRLQPMVIALLLWPSIGHLADSDRIKRGEYILRAAGCVSCHTDTDNDGAFLAGGHALETPFGTFYSPNITAHPKHGIGRWSDQQFIDALTKGISPNGSHYYPAFPYTSYTRMRRDDLLDLKTYLFGLPVSDRPNQDHDLPWHMRSRSLIRLWKLIYFNSGEYRPAEQRSEQWNRGAYLSLGLAHCAECHTERNLLGALKQDRLNAGTQKGGLNEAIPNITPDRQTGIGRWSEDDLSYFLETGATPDGDYSGNLMADVIDEGLSHLRRDDLNAISHYILSLPAINHAVKRRQKKQRGEFD